MRYIILVLAFAMTFLSSGCHSSKIKQLPDFELDNQLVGRWQSVDFIRSPSEFTPDSPSFKGTLYLKELNFYEDGKTNKPFWIWSKGVIYHVGNESKARYIITEFDGNSYLFMEWRSRAVREQGKKPHFYVFKKAPEQRDLLIENFNSTSEN